MLTKVIAKTVVLNERRQVLLIRRSATDERRPGEWDFPGGEVDPGEELTKGVTREIFEEAGLQVAPEKVRLIYAATQLYEDASESVTRLLFVAHVTDPVVTLSFEHDAYQWLEVQDALTTFPHPFYGAGLQYAVDHKLLD